MFRIGNFKHSLGIANLGECISISDERQVRRPFGPPDFMHMKPAFHSLPIPVQYRSSGFCDAKLSWFLSPSHHPTPQGYSPDLPPQLIFECCLQRLGPRPAFFLSDVLSTSTISPTPSFLTISTQMATHLISIQTFLQSPRPISTAAGGQSLTGTSNSVCP